MLVLAVPVLLQRLRPNLEIVFWTSTHSSSSRPCHLILGRLWDSEDLSSLRRDSNPLRVSRISGNTVIPETNLGK